MADLTGQAGSSGSGRKFYPVQQRSTNTKVRIIPEPFKDLALALSKLYNSEERIIIHIFVKYECIKETHLESLLKFDLALLHSHLSNLLADRVIQKRTLDWVEPNGVILKSRAVIYYFLNYKALINIIQLKLHWIRSAIAKKTNSKAALKEFFICTNVKCNRTFSEGHARQLLCPTKNIFSCIYCKFLVVENEVNSETGSISSNSNLPGLTLTNFNEATQPLLDLMRAASECDCSTILVEPSLPNELQLKMNQDLSVNIVGPSNSRLDSGSGSGSELQELETDFGTKRKWSGEVTRFARRNQDVHVVVSSTGNRAEECSSVTPSAHNKKRKALPIWMSTPAVEDMDILDSQVTATERSMATMDMNISTSDSSGISSGVDNNEANEVMNDITNESILFDAQELQSVGIMSDSDDSESDSGFNSKKNQ